MSRRVCPDCHIVDLSGVARAYRVKDANGGAGRGVVLLFGDWARARWDAGNGCWRFRFAHPPGSIVIENVQIRIEGAADRIDELPRQVDWRLVDRSLGA